MSSIVLIRALQQEFLELNIPTTIVAYVHKSTLWGAKYMFFFLVLLVFLINGVP